MNSTTSNKPSLEELDNKYWKEFNKLHGELENKYWKEFNKLHGELENKSSNKNPLNIDRDLLDENVESLTEITSEYAGHHLKVDSVSKS